ncbi:hypothetical protein D3C78_1051210 [compost metagenome]
MGIPQPFNGKQYTGRTSTYRADPISQRIDHLENLVTGLDPLTRLTQKTHHTGVRCKQQFGAVERQAFAGFMGRLRPFTTDQPLLRQERQNAFGVCAGRRAPGISLTTQLEGSRQAG